MPGTPRELSLAEATALARVARSLASRPPAVVAITADAGRERIAEIIRALDPDAVQLSGDEPSTMLPRPVDRSGRRSGCGRGSGDDPAAVVSRARDFLAAGADRILLDAAGGPHPGGTGTRIDTALAAAVAREVPVVLAGGLDPANVAGALRDVPAVGVDSASGTERPRVAGRAPDQGPAPGRAVREARPRRPRRSPEHRRRARPPPTPGSSTPTNAAAGGSTASSAAATSRRR